MKLRIQRLSSEDLGTHYGLFLGTELIHFEFCRSAAEKIATEVAAGSSLYEILYKQINKNCSRKIKSEYEQLQTTVTIQQEQIINLENEITKLRAVEKRKAKDIPIVQPFNTGGFLPRKEINKPTSCELAKKQNVILERKVLDLPIQQVSNYNAKTLALEYSLSQEKANELSKLLVNMSAMDFSSSGDLSSYIKKNNLGKQYPNIAGIVTMQDDTHEWDFDGGFPRDIYKIICQELKLRNKKTSAKAIKFVSYAQNLNIEL